MKKFWQIVGGVYIIIFRNRVLITSLFICLIVTTLLIIQIITLQKLEAFRHDFDEYKRANEKTLNRTYSQVWLLNTQINKILLTQE